MTLLERLREQATITNLGHTTVLLDKASELAPLLAVVEAAQELTREPMPDRGEHDFEWTTLLKALAALDTADSQESAPKEVSA